MSFQVVAGLPPCQVDIYLLLSFMEFLHQNGHSKSNIANYMAAVRTLHIVQGLSTHPFRDQRIPLYLKALKITAPFSPATRPTLDIQTLKSLLLICDILPHPPVLKLFILVASSPFSDFQTFFPTPQLGLTIHDIWPEEIS